MSALQLVLTIVSGIAAVGVGCLFGYLARDRRVK